MEKKVLTMPIKEEDVRELKLGDVVYLTGHIFTSRDMGHLRIRQLLEKGEPLPKDFHGAAIFLALKRNRTDHQHPHGAVR